MHPSDPAENQVQQPSEAVAAAPVSPPETPSGPGAAAEEPARTPRPAGPLPGERPLALLEILVVSGILTDVLARLRTSQDSLLDVTRLDPAAGHVEGQPAAKADTQCIRQPGLDRKGRLACRCCGPVLPCRDPVRCWDTGAP